MFDELSVSHNYSLVSFAYCVYAYVCASMRELLCGCTYVRAYIRLALGVCMCVCVCVYFRACMCPYYGRLAGWLVGCLSGWLAGWLTGWLGV